MDILYMRSGCAQPCEFPEHGPEAGRVARWPHPLSLFNPRQLKREAGTVKPHHICAATASLRTPGPCAALCGRVVIGPFVAKFLSRVADRADGLG